MSNTQLTLSKFFDIKNQAESHKDELLKSPSFQKIKKHISKQKANFPLLGKFYETIFTLIIERLAELLEIDILQDIFVDAWSKQDELLKYANEEQYPPETTVVVPILEHLFDQEYNHLVEPKMSKIKISIGKIELQTEVSFNIEGAILEICNAKIMKIQLGNVVGGGVIKLAGIPFFKKENIELSLPASIDLTPGIPLRKNNQNNEYSTDQDSQVDLFAILI